MRGDLIETFKIINGICNYGSYFFSIFLFEQEIYKDRFQKLNLQTQWIFKWINIFLEWIALSNQKNINSINNF